MRGWNSSNSVSLRQRTEYGPNSSHWAGLPELLHQWDIASKGTALLPDRGAPWPNWVPSQVFEGDTCPLSHRGRFVGSVSSTLGVVSGEGGDKGGLPTTKPVSPGFSTLTRLISSFSFSSCVLLSGMCFEAIFLLCTIKRLSGKTLLCNDINTLT